MPGTLRYMSSRWTAYICLLIVILSLLLPIHAVKENDFKKCKQSGFCKRNRAYADNVASRGAEWKSPYNVVTDETSFNNGRLESVILKTIDSQGTTVRLPLTVTFQQAGTARVTVDEERRQQKQIELRHDSKVRQERYNEAEKWVVVGGLDVDTNAKISHQSENGMKVLYGPDGAYEADIKFSPFAIDFKRDGETHVKLNDRGLMNMEHWRPKIDKTPPQLEEREEGEEGVADVAPVDEFREDESTWWEETFGGNTDSKPRGPESVALDVTFPGYEYVYGIPEHTGPMSLRETRGGEGNFQDPYRMYNSDIFEYITNSPMTLYGSIPLMQAQRKDSTVAVFWLNGAETWVDITKAKESRNPLAMGMGSAKTNTHTHWISEAGIMDIFVFLGPTPSDISKQYGELTGTTQLPQEFSVGYHQCRWNYVSDDDVKDVDRKMDRFKVPYDVIWLDIEYTDDRKYFVWEPNMFSDPISMGEQLDEHGRKLVVIIDPHIKNVNNYYVADELKSKDLAVKNKDDKIYDGWCWPGSSHWVDAFNPLAVEWWKSLFSYDRFKGTMENTFIWNDMSEPSVFNGPEVTMPKDNIHHGGWEHRDVHNINGLTFQNATYEGMITRKPGEMRRPFILTRSFYAGAQRLGAMWTGDNQATWEYLAESIPMVLAQGISGFPNAGADVAGFFGNPDGELMARWYQAGAFYPFFRGHAHIDARRREPYLLAEPYRSIVTAALRLRYALLPSWYTAFYQANRDGSPIVRPMFWTHPGQEAGFGIDDQFYLGTTGLLVKPITKEDQLSQDIFIPDDEVYYDYFSYQKVSTSRGKSVTVQAPLETTPILMRGGHIFPRRDVPRRSAKLMMYDDYTLVVVVGKDGKAEGELYTDDGDTFDYQQGQYIHRTFKLDGSTLTSTEAEGRDMSSLQPGDWLKRMDKVAVDKIIIVGAPTSWSNKKEVQLESNGEQTTVKLDYHKAEGGKSAFAVLGRVGAGIGADWSINFA